MIILKNKKNKKAFFLDRDGVINKDVGYISNIKQFKWLAGTKKAIKYLNDRNFKVIVITNQAGIAKGHIKISELWAVHRYINIELSKTEAKINKFYFCPYHPLGIIKKYRKKSFDRKPNPGMLLKAMKDFGIMRENCYFIGDRKKDQIASNKAKIKFEYREKNLFNQIYKILNKSND